MQSERTAKLIFPPNFNADETWAMNVERLRKGHAERNWYDVLASLTFFGASDSAKIFAITRDRMKTLFPVLIDFVLDAECTVHKSLQSRAYRVFFQMMSKTGHLGPPDIEVSVDKAYAFYKKVLKQRTMEGTYRLAQLDDYFHFLRDLRMFYSEEDGHRILDMYRDRIGSVDTKSFVPFIEMMLFLPSSVLPDVIDDLMIVLDDYLNELIVAEILGYFGRAMRDYPYVGKKFDWTPYLDRIFHAIMLGLRPSIEIAGKGRKIVNGTRAMHHNPIYTGYVVGPSGTACGVVARSFIAGEQGDCALDHFEKLLNILEPMISPRSKNAADLCSFVIYVILNVEQEFKKESIVKRDHKELTFQYMTESQRHRFGKMIVPVLKSMLLKTRSKKALPGIEKVFEVMTGIAYEVMYKDVFLFAVENVVDPEMGPLAMVCSQIIKMMMPFVFEQDHIRDNLMIIPKIFEAAMPNLRSTGSMISFKAFSIICTLCGYLYVDENTDKLGMKERMVANTLLSSFDECIAASVYRDSVEAQVNDEEHEQKAKKRVNLNDRFFAAFSTSFIESKLESIITMLAEGHPRSTAYSFVSHIVGSHNSLLRRVTELLIQRYRNAQASMKLFWSAAISTLTMPCPQLMEVVPLLLASAKEMIDEDDKDHIKKANRIIHRLAARSIGASCLDYRCAPLEDDISKMWGKTFTMKQIDPELFRLSDDQAAEMARQILDVYRPLLDKFDTFRLKEQTQIATVFVAFGTLFKRRGDIVTCLARKLNNELESIMDTVLDYAKRLIQSTTNANIKKDLLFAVVRLSNEDVARINKPVRKQRIIKYTEEGRKVVYPRFQELVMSVSKQNVITSIMIPEHSERMLKFIKEAIIPNVFSDYPQVRQAAITFLSQSYFNYWPGLFEDLVGECCAIIEKEDKTEGMFSGALRVTNMSTHEIAANPELIGQLLMSLTKTKYDKAWRIDQPLLSTLDQLESHRLFVRWADYLAPTFAKLQVDIVNTERGTLVEFAYRMIMYFLATGPAPFTLDVFRFFWESLLSPEAGRKDMNIGEVVSLLYKMRPKKQTTILDHFPEDRYMIDDACVGFLAEPKRVRVATGPAIFPEDYKYTEVRDWFVANFTGDTVEQLVKSLLISLGKNRLVDMKRIDLWITLCWLIGPSIIDLLEPIAQREEEDLEFVIVAAEMTTGVAIGSRIWSFDDNQAALKRVTAPFVATMLNRKRTEIVNLLTGALHYTCGDCDFRRNGWLVEICRSLVGPSGDESSLRNGMFVFEILSEETHPRFHAEVSKVIMESLVPRMKPLSEVSQQNSEKFAQLLTASLISGLTPLEKYKYNNIPVIFDVFDQEYGKTNDNLAIFLGSLGFESKYGVQRVLPFIAERVTKIFELRNSVTVIGTPAIEAFVIRLGRLAWYRQPDQLNRVISDLVKLYPTSTWFIRQTIIYFVHMLCFCNLLMLGRDIYDRIFGEMLPLFVQDEKNELRECAVPIARMLIPVHFGNFETFYNKAILEEKNPKIAAAYAVALIGAITVIDECPEWLPNLFMLAESAHGKVPFFSKMIEKEFGDFWKRTGPREIAAIEEFRYTFSGGYFC